VGGYTQFIFYVLARENPPPTRVGTLILCARAWRIINGSFELRKEHRMFCLPILLFNKEPLKDGKGLTIRNLRSPPVGTLPRPPPSLKNLHIASILVETLSCVFIQLYCHFGMTLSWWNYTKHRIIRCIWNSEHFNFLWIILPSVSARFGRQLSKSTDEPIFNGCGGRQSTNRRLTDLDCINFMMSLVWAQRFVVIKLNSRTGHNTHETWVNVQ
jgi:hypothetical protein